MRVLTPVQTVDSAVLIDVFQEEPGWAARSADALDAASRAGRLTVRRGVG